MLYVRKAEDRGLTLNPWLKSWHTFSFAHYYDPEFTGFSNLRVLNDDTVQAGQGFGAHKHKDMEIITYVLSGSLAHDDSEHGKSILQAGDMQRMSAGSGLTHSEMNPSASDSVHFLQMWILPNQKSLTPSYEQKHFSLPSNDVIRLASNEKSAEQLLIQQDVRLDLGAFNKGKTHLLHLQAPRIQWLQMISGHIMVNDVALKASDGLAVLEEKQLELTALEDCSFLYFDLG